MGSLLEVVESKNLGRQGSRRPCGAVYIEVCSESSGITSSHSVVAATARCPPRGAGQLAVDRLTRKQGSARCQANRGGVLP